MRRVGIASASKLSADAGAAIADAGGNAVDAALASSIVSMCTEPGIIAPGASGFIAIWPRDGAPVVIDAYAEMPGRGLPSERFGTAGREIHMDYGGGMTTIVGYGSIATPGAFAGFGLASERYGVLPWKELFAPAIEAIDHGFPLSPAAAEYLVFAHESIFGWNPCSNRTLHDQRGGPLTAGDTVHISALADTLRSIAEEGPSALYEGSLGRLIASAVRENGGLLGEKDLAAYRAVVREPIQLRLGEWSVATNPPPAVGGACLAAILLLFDDHPLEQWGAAEIRHLATVQRAVLDYRRDRLDSIDADRVGEAARLLDMARMADLKGIIESPSTTHSSAVDSEGTACAITVSAGYGSGAMIEGTGFWLNNSLGEVELHPGGFHALPPGSRLVSNMAPTVARRPDGSVLAIGSPGADRITTAISSVLLNFIHLGQSLTEAVAYPRVHLERFEGQPTIAHEPGLPVEPFDDLIVRRFPDTSMYFGGVAAALWDPIAGHFEAADPRRAGGTARGGTA